jgi:1-acyl-sn-glycerol-3-phosphate acyltransferase
MPQLLHEPAARRPTGGRSRVPVSPSPVPQDADASTADTTAGTSPRPARKPDDEPEKRWKVRALKAFDVLFSRCYHRVSVQSPPQLPRKGPAILVCNHTSGLDPVLIQSACRRLITWMMAKEYYDIKAIGWVFRAVGAIPVERSGRDLSSTRQALRALADGRILGIFPEGKIETTHELLPFQTGVAMMAIKTGVPVYPAYLDGTQRNKEMLRAIALPNRATLRFGPPVEFDRSGTGKPQLEEATAKIQAAVETLRIASQAAVS